MGTDLTDVANAIELLARIERIALDLESVGLTVTVDVKVDVRLDLKP